MSPIKVYQKTISPEEATRFLEKNNNGNRKINDKNVAFLVNQMKTGDWLLTADTIKFSPNGRLLDGQHRLHAIVKYGKPVIVFVAENVDENVFSVLDTGKNRNVSDLLSIQGYANANDLSSGVRSIIMYNKGMYWDANKADRTVKATNTDVIRFVEENPEVTEIISFIAGITKNFNYISRGPMIMLYWVLSRKNQEQADSFFGKYSNGIDLSETSPIRLLRERLIRDSQNKTKLTIREKVGMFIMAWNAYISKKKIERFSVGKGFTFPKAI